jgi:hypothetical protein
MINRSGKNGSTSPNQAVPIDEDEQSKIADDLKAQALKQTATTKSVFYYIYVTVAMIFLFCISYTVFYPYQLEHQRVFEGIVPLYGFLAFYAGSIFCYIVSSMIIKVKPYMF